MLFRKTRIYQKKLKRIRRRRRRKMSLSENEIINLSSYYIKEYNLDEEKDLKNLKEILIQRGNKLFYIFRYISFVKDFLLISKNGKYTIEVPIKKEHFLKKFTKRLLHKSKTKKESRKLTLR